MESPKLVCLGPDAEGWPCGAPAVVHEIRYVFDPELPRPGQAAVEAEYVIECPRCGRRRQVERFA